MHLAVKCFDICCVPPCVIFLQFLKFVIYTQVTKPVSSLKLSTLSPRSEVTGSKDHPQQMINTDTLQFLDSFCKVKIKGIGA